MLAIEERLFDEYKQVDKLCREIFSSQSGVTQYITEMERLASYGRSVIPSWNDDYYKLKRVRWLRNKMAHESGATECNENDAAWLENFHRRLLARQDPLALLGKANRERSNLLPRRKDVFFRQLSSFDEVRLGSPSQRENVSKTGLEQMAHRNDHLQKKKISPLKRAVVTLIVLVEVLIILAAAAVLIIYH